MKYSILFTALASFSVNAADVIINVPPTQCTNGCQITAPIEYPSNYLIASCELIQPVITDPVNFIVEDISFSWNKDDGTCPGRAHYIGMDGLYYPLSNNIYFDFSGFADLLWVKQDYNNCHSASGAAIGDGSPGLLLGNFFLAQLDLSTVEQNYYQSTNIMVTSFTTTTGDIVCDGDVDITNLIIQGEIFKNGFE